ncbi:hypothetical protein K9M47_00365 [Candidatus Gracilibacteria bacterium]|nr:hypothetical protein [Candidatus Gracilibacteria bacterium]MCF7898574.1 hypothetical protein [Candidatus Paceibacterota bacterium]
MFKFFSQNGDSGYEGEGPDWQNKTDESHLLVNDKTIGEFVKAATEVLFFLTIISFSILTLTGLYVFRSSEYVTVENFLLLVAFVVFSLLLKSTTKTNVNQVIEFKEPKIGE